MSAESSDCNYSCFIIHSADILLCKTSSSNGFVSECIPYLYLCLWLYLYVYLYLYLPTIIQVIHIVLWKTSSSNLCLWLYFYVYLYNIIMYLYLLTIIHASWPTQVILLFKASSSNGSMQIRLIYIYTHWVLHNIWLAQFSCSCSGKIAVLP